MNTLVVLLIASFSIFVTVHVVGGVALVHREPRWGLLALLLPPCFPVCAIKQHAAGWAVVWLVTAVAYAIALVAAVAASAQ